MTRITNDEIEKFRLNFSNRLTVTFSVGLKGAQVSYLVENRHFTHSNKQWRRVEVRVKKRVDQNTADV